MFTKEEVVDSIKNSNSIKEAIYKLFGEGSRSYKLFNKLVVLFNLQSLRKDLKERSYKFVDRRCYTNEEIFTKSKTRKTNIRNRILKEKLIPYSCAIKECPTHLYTDKWCGKSLVLDLDHIDGNNRNNKLSNLRFLCKNCHSQTETYGSRNKAEEYKSADYKKYCLICGQEINNKSYKYCNKCKSGRVHKGS